MTIQTEILVVSLRMEYGYSGVYAIFHIATCSNRHQVFPERIHHISS